MVSFLSRKPQPVWLVLPDGTMKMYTDKVTVAQVLDEFPHCTVSSASSSRSFLLPTKTLHGGKTYFLEAKEGAEASSQGTGTTDDAEQPSSSDTGARDLADFLDPSVVAAEGLGPSSSGRPAAAAAAAATTAASSTSPPAPSAQARASASSSSPAGSGPLGGAVQPNATQRAAVDDESSYADVDDELMSYLGTAEVEEASDRRSSLDSYLTKFGSTADDNASAGPLVRRSLATQTPPASAAAAAAAAAAVQAAAAAAAAAGNGRMYGGSLGGGSPGYRNQASPGYLQRQSPSYGQQYSPSYHQQQNSGYLQRHNLASVPQNKALQQQHMASAQPGGLQYSPASPLSQIENASSNGSAPNSGTFVVW